MSVEEIEVFVLFDCDEDELLDDVELVVDEGEDEERPPKGGKDYQGEDEE